MTKVRSLRFSKDSWNKIQRLENLMSLTNTYGSLPKILNFCITFTLSAVKYPEDVVSILNKREIEYYFKMRLNVEKAKKVLKEIENESKIDDL